MFAVAGHPTPTPTSYSSSPHANTLHPAHAASGAAYAQRQRDDRPPWAPSQRSQFVMPHGAKVESPSPPHVDFHPAMRSTGFQARMPSTLAYAGSAPGSREYVSPQGDCAVSTVKQEIKEEDVQMDWSWAASNAQGLHQLSTYALPPAFPVGAAYADAYVNDHQSLKAEDGYDGCLMLEVPGQATDVDPAFPHGVPQPGAFEHGESSPEGYRAMPYHHQDAHVAMHGLVPYTPSASPYASMSPHGPAPLDSPPASPDELAMRAHRHPRPPIAIQNNRSYTLENAIIPVDPPPRGRAPTPAIVVPALPMNALLHPDDVPRAPEPSPASYSHSRSPAPASVPPPSPGEHAPSAPTESSSMHGKPIRRGRGRPRKHPLPTRASPPSLPPPAYDPQAQPSWPSSPSAPTTTAPAEPAPAQVSLDEIPFPEGAEHPGQQVFKLTHAGAAREPAKKKPIMACLFCRERKIACGPPVPGAREQRCNQCARRDHVCEYPKESRRGMHKRYPRAAKVKGQAGAGAGAGKGSSTEAKVDAGLTPDALAGTSAKSAGKPHRRRAGKERRADLHGAAKVAKRCDKEASASASALAGAVADASTANQFPVWP